MEFLGSAIKTLIVLGGIFFAVFSYACFLWTERDAKPSNLAGACFIALLQTFKILFYGTLLLAGIYIIIGFFN